MSIAYTTPNPSRKVHLHALRWAMFEAAPEPLQGQLLHVGEHRVLWQPDTGRHIRVHARTPLSDPPPPLAARLAALGFTGAPTVAIPARSRWALLLPESHRLWHACPLDRGPGGYPFAARHLDDLDVAIWRACDGTTSIAAIAAALGETEDTVRARMRPWMDARVQAMQLREWPVRPTEPALAHLVAPPRPRHARESHHYEEGATDLLGYHTTQITDGSTHFDDRETTFAHAFAIPHPALAGRTYGEALRAALPAAGIRLHGTVLEVGPGTGAVCEAMWTAAERYLRLDLSPELLAVQAARCPSTTSVLGSATAMPLEEGTVDVVIANEMIADLRAAPTPEGFEVQAEPGQGLFNTGAFAMVAEVARVLKPGGGAFISEFGDPSELPEETTHLDHPEVSIHFGQVAEQAERHGLRASIVSLGDFLAVDRSATWLARPSFEALRALVHAEGGHLEARAYTPLSLELPEPVEGLWWAPVTEPGAAPVLDRLWAVLLRKPPL